MSDYRPYSYRALDVGLALREARDRVPEGRWVKLDNTRSTQEALLDTRGGSALHLAAALPAAVHTLKRSGASSLLVGSSTKIYINNTEVSSGFSGKRLTVVPFKGTGSSEIWLFIGDGTKLRKVKEDLTDFKWGIVAPVDFLPSSVGTAGNLDSTVAGAINYDWRAVYVNKSLLSKSNPSPTNPTLLSLNGERANITVTASSDPQVDEIWLFRRGGTITDTWRFTLAVPNVNAVVEDNNLDSDIATNEKLVTFDNAVPFTSIDTSGNPVNELALPYIFGPFRGQYILACGDPNRPGFLYWTNAENPDGASADNATPVTNSLEPLVGGFMYSSNPYVWSKDQLYQVLYGGPDALPVFSSRLTPVGRGLAVPHAYAVGPLVWFLGQDGIYETDGETPARSITEETLRPIFHGHTVEGLSPVDFTKPDSIYLAYEGHELHFIYKDTLGAVKHLIYNTRYDRWRQASFSYTPTCLYGDENQSSRRLLVGDSAGGVHKVFYENALTDENSAAINASARTGDSDFGAPHTLKEYGNTIIDANTGGANMTVTPYMDGVAQTPQVISTTGREKVPLSLGDTYAYHLGYEFSWSGQHTLYGLEVLWRPDEEVIKHWEFPETTHQYPGYQHVRDLYLSLRSGATVTLTVEVDGVVHTYDVPSTGGLRRKVYVELNPTKGKVYRYKLDSSEGFRIYGNDCEVRVKPWNSALGYKLVSPWAPPGGIKVGS